MRVPVYEFNRVAVLCKSLIFSLHEHINKLQNKLQPSYNPSKLQAELQREERVAQS